MVKPSACADGVYQAIFPCAKGAWGQGSVKLNEQAKVGVSLSEALCALHNFTKLLTPFSSAR